MKEMELGQNLSKNTGVELFFCFCFFGVFPLLLGCIMINLQIDPVVFKPSLHPHHPTTTPHIFITCLRSGFTALAAA